MRLVFGLAVCLLAPGVVAGCGGDGTSAGGAAALEGQPWVLASGIPLPQDLKVTRPSATFERGTVGGSTGCNRYTAGYTVDGDSLKLGRIAQTQMACAPPADAIEHAYVGALVKVRGWKSDGGELVLVGADDAELLRYRAATPRGSWQVTAFLRGDAVVSTLAGTTLSATFGADGALSGSAGCNTYKATYRTDKGRIEIGPPAATRMICTAPTGVMEQETAYLSVLPTAVGYRVDGHSLELLSADGTLVATYTRLTAR